jgi:hypothetical protein
MNHDWQTDVRSYERTAATFLPPATVEETGWDILLALHSDEHGDLSLEKLSIMVSVPQRVLNEWLALLEEHEFITGAKRGSNEELRAILTPGGRELLDRYFSAADDLQVGAHH